MLLKTTTGYEWNKLVLNGVLSAVLAFAAIFCVPDIVRIGMGETPVQKTFSVAGLIVSCVIAWVLVIVLYYKRCVSHIRSSAFAKSLGRATATITVLLCIVLLISLICGITASLLYTVLNGILTLSQIKGVINLIATIVTLLGVPFMLSVFWSEAEQPSGRFINDLIGGLRLKEKRYIKLLILLLVLFGIGLLITTAYHYLPNNLAVNISKVVFLTIIGTTGLSVSDKICK